MKRIMLLMMMILLVGCQSEEPEESKNANVIVDVELSTNDATNNHEDDMVADHSALGIEDMEYMGSLSNGDKIYYKPGGKYFNRLIAERIVAETNKGLEILSDMASSIPVISPDQAKVAFVKQVGFERLGQLMVYDGQLREISSSDLRDKTAQKRTLKDCEWYDSDQLFVILGYDTGTITQGGDVYFISLEDGDLRMVLDAKEGKEIVNTSYEEAYLYYEVVTWVDSNYRYYDYSRHKVKLADYITQLPLRIAWEPFSLDAAYLTREELADLSWFTWTPDQSKGFERRQEDGFVVYDNGNLIYRLDESESHLLQILVEDYQTPIMRNVHLQGNVMDVLRQFPNESNYLKTDEGVFYSSEDQRYLGRLNQTSEGFQMVLMVDEIKVTMEFEGDLLERVTVDMK